LCFCVEAIAHPGQALQEIGNPSISHRALRLMDAFETQIHTRACEIYPERVTKPSVMPRRAPVSKMPTPNESETLVAARRRQCQKLCQQAMVLLPLASTKIVLQAMAATAEPFALFNRPPLLHQTILPWWVSQYPGIQKLMSVLRPLLERNRKRRNLAVTFDNHVLYYAGNSDDAPVFALSLHVFARQLVDAIDKATCLQLSHYQPARHVTRLDGGGPVQKLLVVARLGTEHLAQPVAQCRVYVGAHQAVPLPGHGRGSVQCVHDAFQVAAHGVTC
jgi:hypothetical protein